MTERFALYYAPDVTSPLWARAAFWLGRHPAGGPAAAVPGIDADYRIRVAESARRYGFHATIKAPMALAAGVGRHDLEAALVDFGRRTAPVSIGRLVPRFIEGFLALVPAMQTSDLTEAVQGVVEAFEPFRAPLTAVDREKRIRYGRLTARQIELLDRFGYPHVMEEFRLHMTLTDRLPEDERGAVMRAAQSWFADALETDYVFDRITLFLEPAAGAAFVRVADFPLRAEATIDA